MQVHEKLRVMRQFKGWSQEELAEKIGYSVSGYAKIEHGETDINISKLEKIAEVLGVNLQQLLGLSEGNVFNVAENCHYNLPQGSIVLTETQCAHELEKSRLLLQERDKEIGYLKQENERLKEICALLKRDNAT
ncbi:MAG: XRE family transcriptional regulator [Methylococcaceae bacterium]|nr:MAG: XRE family transcriptional regulator [Methylococcaceae bacterium]